MPKRGQFTGDEFNKDERGETPHYDKCSYAKPIESGYDDGLPTKAKEGEPDSSIGGGHEG